MLPSIPVWFASFMYDAGLDMSQEETDMETEAQDKKARQVDSEGSKAIRRPRTHTAASSPCRMAISPAMGEGAGHGIYGKSAWPKAATLKSSRNLVRKLFTWSDGVVQEADFKNGKPGRGADLSTLGSCGPPADGPGERTQVQSSRQHGRLPIGLCLLLITARHSQYPTALSADLTHSTHPAPQHFSQCCQPPILTHFTLHRSTWCSAAQPRLSRDQALMKRTLQEMQHERTAAVRGVNQQ